VFFFLLFAGRMLPKASGEEMIAKRPYSVPILTTPAVACAYSDNTPSSGDLEVVEGYAFRYTVLTIHGIQYSMAGTVQIVRTVQRSTA